MKDIYELAGFNVNYKPSIPKKWKGISEWIYPEDEESENWHAKRIRVGSKDLSDEKYQYYIGSNY